MKKMLVISILGLIFAVNLMAQAPGDTLWTKTYGGTEVDFASSSQQTSDGGFILGGYTKSFGVGNNDFYLIKTDSFGDTLWTKTYGGIQSDCGYSVKQTTDDGFIIAGSTRSFSESLDFYVIKTDVNGNTMWSHTYGGPNTFEDAYSIIQVNDGGYVISGYYDLIDDFMSPNDFFVVRTDAIGDTLWTKKYGSVDIDETALSVQQTSDEGLIIVGNSINYQTMDFLIWLVKTDSNGETLWTQTYLETGYDMMWGSSVQITSEGGFIIAGYAMSFELGADAYATKTDSLGNIIWAKTYGGTQNDFAFSAQQTTDNGYIICGHTGSFGAGGQDIYLIKTNASGDTLWTRTYGGIQNDEGHCVYKTAEDDYIIVGSTESFGLGNYDFWLLRIYDEYIPPINPPQNLFVTELGYATWNVPAFRDLIGYNVYLDDVFVEYTTDLFYQYQDLINGQTYLAGVSAVYDEGESAIIDFEFTPVFDSPQNLDVVCIEDHAHFTWDSPVVVLNSDDRKTKKKIEADETRDLTGYNVYLDQVEVATNIPDLEFDFYDLINGEYYDAGVKAIYDEGTSEIVEINFPYTGTGVENILPLITELTGNYPNPFNPETTISFSTTESTENTELVIYNLKGQKVKTLINEKLPAGNHQVVWDGKDENGKPVSSGIYFYKMNTKDYTSTKRMILMK